MLMSAGWKIRLQVAGCMALLSRILWHILDWIGLDWIANYDTVLLALLLSTVISDVCYKHTVYTCSFFAEIGDFGGTVFGGCVQVV